MILAAKDEKRRLEMIKEEKEQAAREHRTFLLYLSFRMILDENYVRTSSNCRISSSESKFRFQNIGERVREKNWPWEGDEAEVNRMKQAIEDHYLTISKAYTEFDKRFADQMITKEDFINLTVRTMHFCQQPRAARLFEVLDAEQKSYIRAEQVIGQPRPAANVSRKHRWSAASAEIEQLAALRPKILFCTEAYNQVGEKAEDVTDGKDKDKKDKKNKKKLKKKKSKKDGFDSDEGSLGGTRDNVDDNVDEEELSKDIAIPPQAMQKAEWVVPTIEHFMDAGLRNFNVLSRLNVDFQT